MAFYSFLLLLVTVVTAAEVIPYYVRPTQPITSPCPGQPCLTLDQYGEDPDTYFKSNTIFQFLPGTHHMERPVTISNVQNVTIESYNLSEESPHLIALFSCENNTLYHCTPVYGGEVEACCAAFLIHNTHNIAIKDISLSISARDISGVKLEHVSNAHISLITTCSCQDFSVCIGLSVYETRHVVMHSLHVNNCSLGLLLSNSDNIEITNATTVYNRHSGIYLESTFNISITNATVTRNGISGLYLDNTVSTVICSMTATHNHKAGIYFYKSNTTKISEVFATENGWYGMGLDGTNNTNLFNIKTFQNGQNGVFVVSATHTFIKNITASQNAKAGIYVTRTDSTYITNVTAKNNKVGVFLGTITKTNQTQNGRDLGSTTNTDISDTTVMYNSQDGISSHSVENTHIHSTTAAYNNISGIYLVKANNTYIFNTTANYNNEAGVFIGAANNTTVVKTTALSNGWHGLNLNDATSTIISNTTAAYNGHMGIALGNSTHSHITNTAVVHNGWHGLYLIFTNRTFIADTCASNSGELGIYLGNTVHTHIINTTAMYNYFAGYRLYRTNNTEMINTSAVHNKKAGIFLTGTNNTFITETTVAHNDWDGGVSTLVGGITLHTCTNTAIQNSLFTQNNAPMPAQTLNPSGLPAVVVLYYSTLCLSGSSFTANNMSAVKAFASGLTVSGNLTFSDNTAVSGTAFIFALNSIMYLEEESHISFLNNHATDKGGVFHIATNVYYNVGHFNYNYSPLLRTTCFIRTLGNHSKKQLFFADNSAGNGGDVLYGGLVALGLDNDWNCLTHFKNISNLSQGGYSVITSDPSRVCLCNETEQPDCLTTVDPVLHTIHPGQSINISLVAVGQDFGTVTGSVYAQFLQSFSVDNSTQLEIWQYIQSVTQWHCNDLQYTIYSQAEEGETVLVLTTDKRNVFQVQTNADMAALIDYWKSFYHISEAETFRYIYGEYAPVYINISLLPCPPGFMLTRNTPFKCDCNHLLQQFPGVTCHIESERIGRSGIVWVGLVENDHKTSNMMVSDYCSFGYCYEGEILVSPSDPDSQCSNNHSGILCGQCQPGLSVVLGSARCQLCSNKYLALLIPFSLAGPVLVFFIKVLDLTISQGTLNGLIFFANVVKANEYLFFSQQQAHSLKVFIAWLNLDLGVETCFFNGLTAYTKTWMQFLFPIYVWSIAGFIIFIAKHSNRIAKLMGNNSVPVLATLFFLSYSKLFRTIITALSYTKLYSSQGHKAVWSADGNLDYLSWKHAALFTVAAATLLILWLPYTLLLFLGQWLHRCNSQRISCILMRAKPFLDAHYGPLKGKYRCWFGALLLVKTALLLISALVPEDHARVVVLSISIAAVILTFIGRDVYDSNLVSAFDTSFFMYLTLLAVANLFTTSASLYMTVATYLINGIVLVQFLCLVIFKIISILRKNKRFISCLRKQRSSEDEWEMFGERDVLSKTESDAEDEHGDKSESEESFSTY